MDFFDELKQFSRHVAKISDALKTEQATITSLVLPFLKILGYDIFDPYEVVPEFTADIGTKQGEKADFAIMFDNEPLILVEAKTRGTRLDHHTTQLRRYFGPTPARFGILTDGIIYMFFTDLDKQNVMDKDAFYIFDISMVSEDNARELKRFCKNAFNPSDAHRAATELRIHRKMKDLFDGLRTDPQDSFVKYILSEVHAGTRLQVSKFKPIVMQGFNRYINDAISETLKNAIKCQTVEEIVSCTTSAESGLSQKEADALSIIQSVLSTIVSSDRLVCMRKRENDEFADVLLDNNKDKRICRLWLRSDKLSLTIPKSEKRPTLYNISRIEDIRKHDHLLKEVCLRLCNT